MPGHRELGTSSAVAPSTASSTTTTPGRSRLNSPSQYASSRSGLPDSIFRVKEMVSRKAERRRKMSTPPDTRPSQTW